MWRVRWWSAGRVHRKFFTGRAAADSHAAWLRGEMVGLRQRIIDLPPHEAEQLMLLRSEAAKQGVELLALFALLKSAKAAPELMPIRGVIGEMEAAKRRAGRAGDYLGGLVAVLMAFCAGREALPISAFTFGDVERFLDGKALASRATLRSRLSTLFKFAVRRGYRSDNPCSRLEAISAPHVPPAIFTVEHVEQCLKWLRLNPRLLAWFALSTFAGLRPEEAQQTRWRDINFAEGWVKVEAATTKVRQRRVVYPHKAAMAWLKTAKRLKSELPLTTKQRTMELKSLRAVLGWAKWKQDVTRHTAASMWLAHAGSAAEVATALGHSESVLRRHYMALVTKLEAEKFYNLAP